MQYCVNGRQPKKTLAKADVIYINFTDINLMLDLIEDYPTKTYIYELVPTREKVNIKLLKAYSEKVNLIIELASLDDLPLCAENNLKFYWKFPVCSFYDLIALISINPAMILLGPPLSFTLDKVKMHTKEIPLIMFANGNYPYIPGQCQLFNDWIRPEDVPVYEKYISLLMFRWDPVHSADNLNVNPLTLERTLFEVYSRQEWNGNLNLLIPSLGINIDNRSIIETFGENRLSCGQRCLENGACHLCYTAMDFGKKIRDSHYEALT